MTARQTWQDDGTAQLPAQRTDRCRGCGSRRLVPVLDLGEQPLANALRGPRDLDRPERRFPLALVRCDSCALTQVLDSLPPDALFSGDPYLSSIVAADEVAHAHDVLTHASDLRGCVDALAALLGPGGTGIVEVPYLRDLIDGCAFDTICHEHLSYFSLTALDRLLRLRGLTVERVDRLTIDGGSLRLLICNGSRARSEASVTALLDEEEEWGVDSPDVYDAFAGRVLAARTSLRALLEDKKRDSANIAAYGAVAKGSTLLNTFGIGADLLDFVVDASPHKQGCYMPGTTLAIRSPAALLEERPDFALLLSWNCADEILTAQSEFRAGGGRFIVPVPEPRVL